ncbi:MAG TPA: 6-phosphogluconolactonase [Phycisphaerales bacterium]|nr:6-phosphogluconolactonase [Phycisphaerales bacterium]
MSELIPLEPMPDKPALPGTVILRRTSDEVIDALAADLLMHALNCVRTFGDFHLALSGGSTPMPLYQRLMVDPRYRDLPWGRTHLWIVDERRVPFDDERSNYKHIGEIFADHSGIPRSHLHPMMPLESGADAAYEKALREALAWREPGQDRLDFVLLGMGADGHTASLFPHSPALMEELEAPPSSSAAQRLVRVNAGEHVTPPDRLTMTLRLINASRFIALLVTGKGKREMVRKVAARARAGGGPDNPASVADLPVLGVRPIGGELRWYLDQDACS